MFWERGFGRFDLAALAQPHLKFLFVCWFVPLQHILQDYLQYNTILLMCLASSLPQVEPHGLLADIQETELQTSKGSKT
jgi:hypothetical protein